MTLLRIAVRTVSRGILDNDIKRDCGALTTFSLRIYWPFDHTNTRDLIIFVCFIFPFDSQDDHARSSQFATTYCRYA